MLTLLLLFATEPVKPEWSPLLVPTSVLAPGTGQFVRGDQDIGAKMLIASGASLATVVAGGAALIASGGSDAVTIAAVPLMALAIGTYLGMGLSDAVGTFASEEFVMRDAWNARLRAGAFVRQSVMERVQEKPSSPFIGTRAHALWERFSLFAEGGANTLGEAMVIGGGGVKLWGWDKARAGLWLDTSVRGDFASPLGYQALRWRIELAVYVPMGIFDPRFSRVFLKLRAGVDPSWIFYPARTNFEVPLAAGIELRLALHEYVRVFAGYDHARDEQWGGQGLGFVGAIHTGAEVSLPAGFVLSAQYVFATQGGIEAAVEWRW